VFLVLAIFLAKMKWVFQQAGYFIQRQNELVSQLGNQSTNRLFIIPSVIQSLSACQPTDHFIQLKDDQSVTSQLVSQLARQSVIKPNNQSAI